MANARQSNSEKAYDWIKEQIDAGAFKMGEPLPETFLAKATGVSRTPVREALRALEQDGYVRIVPLKGAFVSEVSIEDVREIFDIRKLLEPFAALTAATRMPRSEIDAMSKEWEHFAVMAERGIKVRFSDIAESDLNFHLSIARNSANKRIGAILTGYHVQIKRFQRLSAQSLDDAKNSIEQHLKIIGCLKLRNPEILRLRLYDHVAASESYILKKYFLM